MLPRPDDPTYEPTFVAALIERALPALRHAPVAPLDRGWDCDVFRLGETHVVRIARNPSASQGISLDARLLPLIGTQLPLPVPTPLYLGTLPGGAGLCFGVYRFLPGCSLNDATLTPNDYASLAPALGHFLRCLHSVRVPADFNLPGDEFGRLDPARKSAATHASLAQLRCAGALTGSEHAELEAALARAEQSPLSSTRVLVHGDLHPWNMLVHQGRFSGIIDWVDAHHGHPATDLAAPFVTLPAAHQPAFFEAYGAPDASTLAWARWRAITWLTIAQAGSLARNQPEAAASCVARLKAMARPSTSSQVF